MKTAIVSTTINAPSRALQAIAAGAVREGSAFIVIGDSKSPANFALQGCSYFDLDAQRSTGLGLAAVCPTEHYARKNIGYLLAIGMGADLIVETDDDNVPQDAFFGPRIRCRAVPLAAGRGWFNVYRYFSEALIWPRGLPLSAIHTPASAAELPIATCDCPIQQGLADHNPDVDAIYRLVLPLPQFFRADRQVALARGTWCPFNSQNTAWWSDAFPLLYLPAYCSFRMTDIWRSFVAQRIAWENGWHVLFHAPTVWQDRNEHDLMQDFAQEIPGYLHNDEICRHLEKLPLTGGTANLHDDLRACYRCLIELQVVGLGELTLLNAWLEDLQFVKVNRPYGWRAA